MEATLTRISYYTYQPELLVDARERQELSIQQIADGTKLDRATVWRVLRGRAASYESVELICTFLRLAPSAVIRQAEHKNEMRGKSKKISVSVA